MAAALEYSESDTIDLNEDIKEYIWSKKSEQKQHNQLMFNIPAAWLTAILCEIQSLNGYLDESQSVYMEIGVFKGDFLALLRNATARYAFPIVGVDPFEIQGQSKDDVITHLRKNGQFSDRFKLVESYSSDLDKYKSEIVNRSVDMIHVDGSHQYAHVVADLKLADHLASSHSILIIDDFPKPRQLEVLEATFDFLKDTSSEFMPFAVSTGKLFCCKPEYYEIYKKSLVSFSSSNTGLYPCKLLTDRLTNGPRWQAIQRLIGKDVIAF